MKCRCLLLSAILLSTLLISGCDNQVRQEVELFNSNTDETINRYTDIKSAREGKTEELILNIANQADLGITLTDNSRKAIQEASKLLKENELDTIEAIPFIKSDTFYTRLGYKFVTQIVEFGYRGKAYLLEILWTSDSEIDTLNLEVLNNAS